MNRVPYLFVALLCGFVACSLAKGLPKPTGIRVNSRTKNSLRINWRNPPSQTYERFSVTVTPEAEMDEPADLGQRSRTLRGLQPGERYTVFIQGFSAEGLPSSVLKHEVWTVPEKPSGLSTKPIHEITISISIMGIKTKFTALVDGLQVEWNDDREEKMITGYDLQISPDDGVAVESDDVEPSSTVKRIITGLTPGEEYTVSLRSQVGPDYDPIYSEPIRATMRMPPAVPYSVEVAETEPTGVTLKTHGPIEGIHDDLDFILQPRHGSFGEASPDSNYPMFDLYPVNGLKPGTTYFLQVYALSFGVRGFKPYNLTFNTKPMPPLKIRVVDYQHESVTLQWNHGHKFNELDEVQYRIEFFEEPNGKQQSATVKNFKIDQPVVVQVHELNPGTVYHFNVYTILNGIKSSVPAEVIQTTIPRKPTLTEFSLGVEKGVTVAFGNPKQGKCPLLKVFYSPGLNGGAITPAFHQLEEVIIYEEVPTDGRYTVHARCISMSVEGPELVISTLKELPAGNRSDEYNDRPRNGKTPLPCVAAVAARQPRPEAVAPNACCGARPYHTAEKECCGDYLLDKVDERLCCMEDVYHKIRQICCDNSVIRLRSEGCGGGIL